MVMLFNATFNNISRGRRDHDRMMVGFTTAYTISAYHHWCCEFESRSGRGVQHFVIKWPQRYNWNIVENGVKHHHTNNRQTIFQLYREISFIGGGNRRTRRKSPTCCKSMINLITKIWKKLYSVILKYAIMFGTW